MLRVTSGNDNFYIFFQQYPYIIKGKVIRIYIKCSLKEENAFIFYQKKEDVELGRDHKSKEDGKHFPLVIKSLIDWN